MSTVPAHKYTVEGDEHRASTGRHKHTQWREMGTGPAQEDTGERDELRASTGRHSGER